MHAFFVMEIQARTVHVLGITANPAGTWTARIGRGQVPGGLISEYRRAA
jgi:hypothetical protein